MNNLLTNIGEHVCPLPEGSIKTWPFGELTLAGFILMGFALLIIGAVILYFLYMLLESWLEYRYQKAHPLMYQKDVSFKKIYSKEIEETTVLSLDCFILLFGFIMSIIAAILIGVGWGNLSYIFTSKFDTWLVTNQTLFGEIHFNTWLQENYTQLGITNLQWDSLVNSMNLKFGCINAIGSLITK
ncbi:hypothetical protein ELUMI_v1c05400 [Williamsoniiplasma luminosum]|uniref:Uncharacterized protein n=1 Tax=Williamsoniiplasma luminosum TaxID=214888 RepID=A0A2K8NU15_9MOLU|nr:hypothetical protein [Williamsoniiplasma luminosum]ATZ17264.1 hypothetical protein ELUMI_v1c05400 [Williamsoniiplasma luminosum]